MRQTQGTVQARGSGRRFRIVELAASDLEGPSDVYGEQRLRQLARRLVTRADVQAVAALLRGMINEELWALELMDALRCDGARGGERDWDETLSPRARALPRRDRAGRPGGLPC